MGARGVQSDVPALVRQLATEPAYQHHGDRYRPGTPHLSRIADATDVTPARVGEILRGLVLPTAPVVGQGRIRGEESGDVVEVGDDGTFWLRRGEARAQLRYNTGDAWEADPEWSTR